MGSEQIDLTVASFDASISKAFGVEGTFSFECTARGGDVFRPRIFTKSSAKGVGRS
ncbi:MAG: hypothetical protein HZC06_01575 [Methylocystis sp.]|nr:hypothetical protein [Methylocystis sp.]